MADVKKDVRPGKPTAFEGLVDDYDAARPSYPDALYGSLPKLGACLELGAGTGIASARLAAMASRFVVSDLGPKMLARGLTKHDWPGVVCRAEALPFRDASFDTVIGAQMWHWVDTPGGPLEVQRVLKPGGRLLLWWNEPAADGKPWLDRQQERLEAGNPLYRRGYREVDYNAELAPWFDTADPVVLPWSRTVSLDLYERWLRSKSYVQELVDVDGFIAASLADVSEAYPSGQVEEDFFTRLWSFRRKP